MEKLDTTEDRLILVNRLSDKAYDTIFSKIDILLDTFPYSGTTTTCNALFNSVPVVTLYNQNNHCHSVSSSILINAELPELVAHTNAEYIEIVRRLTEPALLNMYKSTIGAKFSAMMEPKKFMESYESILSNLCKNGNLKLAAV
jgi:predicted O-linked N-acetylglucosamine transferase (SPINDLY family)